MNCHFVSKFITKPWENENRELIYYDFLTDKIEHESYLYLFSRPDDNSHEEETFINKYIEAPLTDLQNIVINNKPIKKWKVYRAIYLLGLLQAPRFFKNIEGYGPDISKLFLTQEETINSVVKFYDKSFCIKYYHLSYEEHLFFPELGFFVLPLIVPNEPSIFKFAYCLPIDPKILIMITPRDIDEEIANIILSVPQLIMGFSVGIVNLCNKVVIPLELLNIFPQDKIIEAIKYWRSLSDKYLRSTTDLMNHALKIYDKLGINMNISK
jgi:hypothetical protein